MIIKRVDSLGASMIKKSRICVVDKKRVEYVLVGIGFDTHLLQGLSKLTDGCTNLYTNFLTDSAP